MLPTRFLARFRAALRGLYGDRLVRAVLFGSRARSEARPDSDYDVAVFLDAMPDRWAELDQLAAPAGQVLEETGVFLDARPYAAGAFRDPSPLMHEIRREGVDFCARKPPPSWKRRASF